MYGKGCAYGVRYLIKLVKRFKTGLDKLVSENPHQINKERHLRFFCLFFICISFVLNI